MRFGLIFFLLSAVIAAAVQQPPFANHRKFAGTCKIEGSVIAADSGQPLRKAVVMLQKMGGQAQPQYTLTDATGHFELKSLEATA